MIKLMASDHGNDTRFTTLFDLYGLPEDFPGLGAAKAEQTSDRRAEQLERAMMDDIGDRRLMPYLQVHEFETYVFVDLTTLESLLDPQDRPQVIALAKTVAGSAPEQINDAEATAPSKRLRTYLPMYQKTVHGPLVTEAIGLARIRGSCPRFDKWLNSLERLGDLPAVES